MKHDLDPASAFICAACFFAMIVIVTCVQL